MAILAWNLLLVAGAALGLIGGALIGVALLAGDGGVKSHGDAAAGIAGFLLGGGAGTIVGVIVAVSLGRRWLRPGRAATSADAEAGPGQLPQT